LRFDAFGRPASAGNNVRKLSLVGVTIVTFDEIAVAEAGISHAPF